jgi:NTP pyrophosphatase (non-canonical NTP hydrolase)
LGGIFLQKVLYKDDGTTLGALKNLVKTFCEERDWDQYHNAKDLAIGIITESSELLEIFRFKSEREIDKMFTNEHRKQDITEELADVLYFVLRFAERYQIDLSTEFHKKM